MMLPQGASRLTLRRFRAWRKQWLTRSAHWPLCGTPNMDRPFSMPDVAARIAKEMGPFLDAAEQAEAAKSASHEDSGKAEILLYNARARLTAEAKQTGAAARKAFGLGK